jgi:hypothetical protein
VEGGGWRGSLAEQRSGRVVRPQMEVEGECRISRGRGRVVPRWR